MDKVVTLFGDITEDTYNDFEKETSSLSKSDTLTVCISSFGGLLDEGWKIYDKMQQLQNDGIYTIVLVDKYCMSSAVLPLLAVPVNRRFAREYSQILIHQPYYSLSQGTNLRANELAAMANDLNDSISALKEVYASAFATANQKQIDTLMDMEQPICADLAVRLGIVGSIVRKKLDCRVFNVCGRKAKHACTAEGKFNKGKIETNCIMKNKTNILDKLINALSAVKLDLVVSSLEGIDIVVPSKEDNAELEVGDKVDNTPDGVYTIDGGTVVTISNGEIADIQKPTEEEEEPTEPAEDKPVEEDNKEIKNEVEPTIEEQPSVVAEEDAPVAPEVTIAQFNELADRVSALEAAVAELAANSSSLEAMDEKLKSFGNIFKELKNAVAQEPEKQQITKDYAYYKSKGVF